LCPKTLVGNNFPHTCLQNSICFLLCLPVWQLRSVSHYGTFLCYVICSGVNCNWTRVFIVPKKCMIFNMSLSDSSEYNVWSMCGHLNGLPLCSVIFSVYSILQCQSQWLRGLRCRSAAARLLRLWVWIPPGAWMSVCCEYCVLSSRGLCDELITHLAESYWLWCVVCDIKTSWMRRVCCNGGLLCQKQTNSISQSAIFQKLKDKNCIQCGVVDIVTWLWALWSDVSFPAVTRNFFLFKSYSV